MARRVAAPIGSHGVLAPVATVRAVSHQRNVDKKSTLLTSQLPVDQWHAYLGDPTLADAILDRLVHNAYRLTLKGDSMRKRQAKSLTAPAAAAA